MALDFTSKPAAGQDREQDPPVELQFKLDKVPFKCVLRTDADSLLEWSEMAASADDTEMESPAGMAFVSRFFKLMMPADQYRAFRAHLRTHVTDQDVLIQIMQGVNEAMEAEVERETDRPTQPSSRSSSGREATGGRTAKIISLSAEDGDIEYAEPRQVSRNQRRNQRRRRAG